MVVIIREIEDVDPVRSIQPGAYAPVDDQHLDVGRTRVYLALGGSPLG